MLSFSFRLRCSKEQSSSHGFNRVRDGLADGLRPEYFLIISGLLAHWDDPVFGFGIFQCPHEPIEAKTETNSEQMEVGDESHLHALDVSLRGPGFVLLPFIRQQSCSKLQNCISVSLKCFKRLSRRGHSIC